jgi:pimeloyl-ACP methyl ester carboxylesterase
MRKTSPILVVVAMTLTLATIGTASAGERPALIWQRCDNGQEECTTIQVPLNYLDGSGKTISLEISRISAARPELRRGVLVLIPGGPGLSGLAKPAQMLTQAKKMPQAVLDRYDLIGFDPRGVGASSPVSCDLPDADVAPVMLRPWPAPDGDITANITAAKRTAEACARNGGDELPSVTSLNNARDLDSIRKALGENKISAWGVSYGTYVGSLYTTLFPGRTDRVVLDSNDDPNPALVGRGWLRNTSIGVADRFGDFAAWGAKNGVAATSDAVRAKFLGLAAQLDQHPRPWPGASPPQLDGNVLRSVMLQSLNSDSGFTALAALMKAAEGPTLPPPSVVPPAAMQNGVASGIAPVCNDVAWPRSTDSYAKAVPVDKALFPLTAGMPANIMPCAFWPKPAEAPVTLTSNGPSNILMVQNLRDPQTPYSGALKMRSALGGRARLVSVDSGGHQSYLQNGNACGDAAVTAFLVTGTRPVTDMLCR